MYLPNFLCQVSDINKDIKIDSMPVRMGFPAYPTPTSKKLAEHYYPTAREIVVNAFKLLKRVIPKDFIKFDIRDNSDQPDQTFKGPF